MRLGDDVHAFERWVTYGLFAGGGLDVMTAFLLETMTRSSDGWLGSALRGTPEGRARRRDRFRRWTFARGPGRSPRAFAGSRPPRVSPCWTRTPSRCAPRGRTSPPLWFGGESVLDSSEPDGSSPRSVHLPAAFALGDGWTGLSSDERFDLIVSNPPVHLGLRPEFTVLKSMCAGFDARLKPGGEAWFVAQRYVPVAGICAGIGGLAAKVARVCANDKFAVWSVRKPPGAGRGRRIFGEESCEEGEEGEEEERRSREGEERQEGEEGEEGEGSTHSVGFVGVRFARLAPRSHHASASSSALAMPLGSPGSYGVNPRGSNVAIAFASPPDSHHRRCPRLPSSSASSAW